MTKVMNEKDIDLVAEAINRGEIVAFPTETVYGLGVKFNDKEALNRLFIAKNRPENKSVTLMVAKKEDISKYAIVGEATKKMIDAFMPGRITLILKKKENVSNQMTMGRDTIGIRIPDHPFVLSLLEKTGPMLVTSANLSGENNTTTTKEVLDQLDGRISMVVDGVANSTVASTVVDVTKEIKILREGSITLEEIKGELEK